MDTRLQDRIAVITGASSGIGKATAFKFANSGARIVCADLKSVGVENEINAKYGKDRATFITCNVTSESAIENLVTQAVQWGGRLDIMANYAGVATEHTYGEGLRTHDLPTEAFDKAMAINVRGVWLCCKYALAQMLAQEPRLPNARGERTRGWIVNAASVYGLVGAPNAPAYVASKHAVVGMTRQMAIDYAKDRVHVNALSPGFIQTPFIDFATADAGSKAAVDSLHPWNAIGRPEDIADAALFLVSDEAAWVTGHALVVDGGYVAQ